MSSRADPHRIIAGLARDGTVLELKTVDLCFVTALYLHADEQSLTSLEEEAVIDVFEQVCDLVEPGADNPRKRATHAIQRLRDQRMLARVDASGVVVAGDYTLTSLAIAIVRSFIDDEQLTRESLSLLTRAVILSLGRIKTAATRALGEDAWHAEVVGPLRITIGDLIGGIERRQRGLDSQQQEVQQQISGMLGADWFGAIDQCQALLETTTSTLKELNEILLRDGSQIQTLLGEIQQLALEQDAHEADEACQRVSEQVDRVTAWGVDRQSAWSGYYQSTHRYLRDVVRLDPERALSQRLLDQVRGWRGRPFYLVVADAGRLELLRQVETRRFREPVSRPRRDREREPDIVVPENRHADLEERVRTELAAGARDLATVTRRVLVELDEAERYAAIGRIAALVAELASPRPERDRPWVAVDDATQIEDWPLVRSRKAAKR